MLRTDLANLVSEAVDGLIRDGFLSEEARIPIEIADTKTPEHGDFACNYALVATKRAGKPPRVIAEALRERLLGGSVIEAVEVAGPGFLNFRLYPAAISGYVSAVVASGSSFGHVANRNPIRLNVEFVSVNPNGPITVGSARGAAFGDTLCRVFAAAGNVVHREYYINDGVNSEQMRQFAAAVRFWTLMTTGRMKWDAFLKFDVTMASLARPLAQRLKSEFSTREERIAYLKGLTDAFFEDEARRQIAHAGMSTAQVAKIAHFLLRDGEFTPDDHQSIVLLGRYLRTCSMFLVGDPATPGHSEFVSYRGDYVKGVADNIRTQYDGRLDEIASLDISWWQSICQESMINQQRQSLGTFRVAFDTWFSEQGLHNEGEVARCLDELTSKGVADTEPYRTVVKFAKGGVVDSITREAQTGAEVEDDDPTQPEPSPSGGGQGEGESSRSHLTSEANPQADTLTPAPVSEGEGLRTLWLRSTKFGDDMDRVLRRRDGRLTYIASDVAYHKDKFNRPPNAEKLITILGPDHHGYIGRLHAVLAALLRDGVDTDENNRAAFEEARTKLEVLIFQIVRFVKDGKPAPMRKRDGNIYALIDLIDEIGANLAPDSDTDEQKEVGADVARFFYLMRSHDTHMDFDIDLATKQSDENPVFYVQYAHARICSVIDKAGAITPGDGKLLTHPRELALIKKILDLPHEVSRSAADYGVHRLATYAVELARTYHHFYDACRVIQPDEPALTADRLLLCDAARIALSQVCGLLGVRAPRRLDRAAQST